MNCDLTRRSRNDDAFDFPISMAFQPIVDMRDLSIFGYEALVRGARGEPASDVLRRVTPENRFAFDQRCRARALELAASLGVRAHLSINFMPEAVQAPAHGIVATQDAARRAGIPFDQIILEASEEDRRDDPLGFRAIMSEYKRQGFTTAIDDFGDGFASLSFLADFQPDYLKLDMNLIRGIDTNKARQAIVGGIAKLAELIGTRVIAEGVETAAEMRTLRDLHVAMMQGYLFAAPKFEAFPVVDLCRREGVRRAHCA